MSNITVQNLNQVEAIWPDLYAGAVTVSPPRNGMDRFTGKLLQGWDHVDQSINLIFVTRFHTRVLRRWVGSFVPVLLGRNYVARRITLFYWSIASALDMWEPDYRLTRVYFMTNVPDLQPPLTQASAEALVRAGEAIFQHEGVYYPRGHLGNFTPASVVAAPAPTPLG